ncbi:MAG: DUF5063 domain-containing protein [Phycisphaerales bacterium]
MANDHDLISPNDPEASAFAAAARAYCDFIDAAIVQRPDPFYGPLQGLLIRLVETVEPLPCFPPSINERTQAQLDEVAGKSAEPMGRSIAAVVSSDTKRLEEWASHDPDGNERRFVLFDDLSDVYCELRGGLALWDLGHDLGRSAAVYKWRWGYEYVWGYDLFPALLTIYEMRFGLQIESLL